MKSLPQQSTAPPCSSAQVCASPAATATAVVMPLTRTGVADGVVVPLPSCPDPFAPQQATVPFWSTAQLCSTAGGDLHGGGDAADQRRTGDGRGRALAELPRSFAPQQSTVPSGESRAGVVLVDEDGFAGADLGGDAAPTSAGTASGAGDSGVVRDGRAGAGR